MVSEPVSVDIRLEGADGLSLAATRVGEGGTGGAPVLLLGGLAQTRHSWKRAAGSIALSGRQAIMLDIRGHGDSDRAPDGDYSYERQVADLVSVIGQIGGSAILTGASFGGKISLAVAGRRPDLVAGLVLVDSVPRTVVAGVKSMSQAFSAPEEGFASPEEAATLIASVRGRVAAPGDGEKMQRNLRRDDAGRWHWHWDRGYSDPAQGLGVQQGAIELLESAARNVSAPTLLTRGELSNVVDDAGAEALLALIPHAQTEVIAGAGHMLVGDQNDLFADSLLRFLAGLDV